MYSKSIEKGNNKKRGKGLLREMTGKRGRRKGGRGTNGKVMRVKEGGRNIILLDNMRKVENEEQYNTGEK